MTEAFLRVFEDKRKLIYAYASKCVIIQLGVVAMFTFLNISFFYRTAGLSPLRLNVINVPLTYNFFFGQSSYSHSRSCSRSIHHFHLKVSSRAASHHPPRSVVHHPKRQQRWWLWLPRSLFREVNSSWCWRSMDPVHQDAYILLCLADYIKHLLNIVLQQLAGNNNSKEKKVWISIYYYYYYYCYYYY